ncbi:MAG: PKD domain-containing protein, partial [Bacteroidota bacterium]
APLEDCRAELELDASFTFEQICDPQDGTFVVSFTSAASVQGSEYTHTWDFGVEGISTDVSTDPNPTYDGYTAGNFKVVHTVSNACITETFTEILKLPDCNFLCTPAGCGNNIFKIKGPVSVSQLGDVDANGNPIYVEGNPNATCYQIRGVLTIDVPFALVDKQVTMEPGSAVIVNPNVKLSIENSDISSCKMWTGITVEAAGNLDIFDNSSIQDAINAVQLVEGSNLFSLGTLFDRNVVGIRINGTPNLLGFENNTFSCSSTLNDVSDATNGGWGYAGIISNAASYAIGNLDQTSTVLNTFKDTDYGVICSRGSIVVADAKFENLRKVTSSLPFGSDNSSGVGIYGYLLSEAIFSESQFSNLSTGIFAAVCPLNAQFNSMVTIEQGIRLKGPTFQFEINKNEINPSQVGIYLSGGAALSGIGPRNISLNTIQLSGGEARNRAVIVEGSPFTDGRFIEVSSNEIDINNVSSTLFQAVHILSS